MHTPNFFFSPQGGRSSYIKNRTIRPVSSGCPLSRAWNGLLCDVLGEPASVDLFKSCVNKLPLT
nr:unnamed protein product [Callosobruchus chinensis]